MNFGNCFVGTDSVDPYAVVTQFDFDAISSVFQFEFQTSKLIFI